MSKSPTPLRLFLLSILVGFTMILRGQNPQEKGKPNLVFQFSSHGMARFEIRDAIEGQYELLLLHANESEEPKPVRLTESERKYLNSLLQSLKKESYSLSLPPHGVVVICDGEMVEIELDAISVRLLYRDEYETAKSHKPIRLLVNWVKNRFPMLSVPK